MSNILHVGDIGTVITALCHDGGVAVNISSATEASERIIKLQSPDGNVTDKAAEFGTNGSDGILTYETIAGDLDQKGDWKIQPQVVLDTGQRTFGKQRFHVHPVIGD
jgi:hypothetical protein